MKKNDIVIYEKDSADLTFSLSEDIVAEFTEENKIVWALKRDIEGLAILLKECIIIGGNKASVNLTKQDTFKLCADRYFYDLILMCGETIQTTLIKSGNFIVSSREIPKRATAEITLDTLAQYQMLVNQAEGYAQQAAQSATLAGFNMDAISQIKVETEAFVTSASQSINEQAQAVEQSKRTVQQAVQNVSTVVSQAIATINNAVTNGINDIQIAEGTAKASAENAAVSERNARASETNARNSENVSLQAKISSEESSDASHRYALMALGYLNEVRTSTQELLAVASQTVALATQLEQRSAELLDAADATEENVARAILAESNSLTYSENASASASSAESSATTATSQAQSATSSATEARTSAANASSSATSSANSAREASTYASNASTSATEAQGYSSSASASASSCAGYASSAQTSATNAENNASAASTSATNASNSATQAEGSASNALSYSESARGYAEQTAVGISHIVITSATQPTESGCKFWIDIGA